MHKINFIIPTLFIVVFSFPSTVFSFKSKEMEGVLHNPHSFDQLGLGFQVFESIGFENKPNLDKLGLTLFPMLVAHSVPQLQKGLSQSCKIEIQTSQSTPNLNSINKLKGKYAFWPQVNPWCGFWNHRPEEQNPRGYVGQPEWDTLVQDSAKSLTRNPKYKDISHFFINLEPKEFPKLKDDLLEVSYILQNKILEICNPSKSRRPLDIASLNIEVLKKNCNDSLPLHDQDIDFSIVKKINRENWQEAIKIMKKLVTDLRQNNPFTHQFGFYGEMPSYAYTANTQVEGLNILRDASPQGLSSGDERSLRFHKATQEFYKIRNEFFMELARTVDMVLPSLYTPYMEPEEEVSLTHKNLNEWTHSGEAWRKNAEWVLQEARKYGKPVYAFLWPQYHDEPKACQEAQAPQRKVLGCDKPDGRDGFGVIPGDYWRFQLETVYELADGLVIWDYSQSKEKGGDWNSLTNCNDSSHWWYETLDFLYDRNLIRDKVLKELTPLEACKKFTHTG